MRLEPREEMPEGSANPALVAGGYALLAHVLADSATTLLDQAAIVATPFVITSAANYGAAAGAEEGTR